MSFKESAEGIVCFRAEGPNQLSQVIRYLIHGMWSCRMKVIANQIDTIHLGAPGESGTGAGPQEEQQSSKALNTTEDLVSNLMEKVCERANLNQAYKRVKSNRGSAGVDGMTVESLGPWIKLNKVNLIASLLDGSYQPQPVREVEIPKPGNMGEYGNLEYLLWSIE